MIDLDIEKALDRRRVLSVPLSLGTTSHIRHASHNKYDSIRHTLHNMHSACVHTTHQLLHIANATNRRKTCAYNIPHYYIKYI